MTNDDSTGNTPGTDAGSGDLFNTAAGWVLFAAGLGLGLSILSGKFFHGDDPQRPATLGYVIELPEGEEAPAEMTMTQALNMDGVDISAGERVFAKCSACHTVGPGGANGVGPNLHAIMGAPVGAVSGYSYSTAMASFGGNWGWDEMNEWLENPRGYMDGTKMGFAGLSKIEDRAAVSLFMNELGSNLEVPAYVEDVIEDAEAEAEGEGEQNVAEATSEETADAAAS